MSSRWTTTCRTRRRRSSACSPLLRSSGKEVDLHLSTTKSSTPIWRNLGSRFANRVADFVLEKPKGLYLSSFRCMSAFVVREITRYEGPFPYVDGLILQVTHDIDRLMVRHLPRAVGRSNYTLRRLLRLWVSMFVNFSVMPLRISTLTGFVAERDRGDRRRDGRSPRRCSSSPPAGWASLMAAVLLLSGVQLVILGIVGEYLGRLYLTANGKPQSVIKEVRRSRSSRAAEARPPVRLRESARRDDGDLLHKSRGGDPARHCRTDRAEIGAPTGSATVVAQFLNPLTMIGLRDLYPGGALLHPGAEEDPGLDRLSVGRGELRGRRGARACAVERAARLAAAGGHRIDRQRRVADPSALKLWPQPKKLRISAMTRSTASSESCG